MSNVTRRHNEDSVAVAKGPREWFGLWTSERLFLAVGCRNACKSASCDVGFAGTLKFGPFSLWPQAVNKEHTLGDTTQNRRNPEKTKAEQKGTLE